MNIFNKFEKKSASTILIAVIILILVLENNYHYELFYKTDIAEQSSYIMTDNNDYRIYINLEEMNLYLFNDDIVEKTYPISGGKPSAPSPIGEWIITEKSDWGEGFGGYWMGLNVPWGTYGIHGTNKPWVIGKENASKGCIRMKSEDAKALYSIIPYATKVTIEYPNQPFRILKNGDVGSDVLKVQKALKELGYFSYYCDGKYGSITSKAVKRFQKNNGLSQTGIVNESTFDLLFKDGY